MSEADEIKEILEKLDKIKPEQLDKAIKEADKYYQEQGWIGGEDE